MLCFESLLFLPHNLKVSICLPPAYLLTFKYIINSKSERKMSPGL